MGRFTHVLMNCSMNKYVIYTVMAGKYGEVRQPLVIDDRFDYVLFSNDFKETKIGVWQVRPIPIPPEIEATDNKRLSRYPKAHPETMLAEYDASLYIDANIQIADQWVFDRIIELSTKHIEYAGVKLCLTGRDDIYRHAYDMCIMRAENDYNAIVELHALRQEKFPEHFGLNENNIIYREHTTTMKLVDELWWKWIVQFSFRDQFSYMYCLWKFKLPISYFLPIGTDARNSSYFIYHSHNENPDVSKKKWVNQGVLETWRNKCRTLTKFHRKWHCFGWVLLSRIPHPEYGLVIFGIISTIVNAPLIAITILCKQIKGRKQ